MNILCLMKHAFVKEKFQLKYKSFFSNSSPEGKRQKSFWNNFFISYLFD